MCFALESGKGSGTRLLSPFREDNQGHVKRCEQSVQVQTNASDASVSKTEDNATNLESAGANSTAMANTSNSMNKGRKGKNMLKGDESRKSWKVSIVDSLPSHLGKRRLTQKTALEFDDAATAIPPLVADNEGNFTSMGNNIKKRMHGKHTVLSNSLNSNESKGSPSKGMISPSSGHRNKRKERDRASQPLTSSHGRSSKDDIPSTSPTIHEGFVKLSGSKTGLDGHYVASGSVRNHQAGDIIRDSPGSRLHMSYDSHGHSDHDNGNRKNRHNSADSRVVMEVLPPGAATEISRRHGDTKETLSSSLGNQLSSITSFIIGKSNLNNPTSHKSNRSGSIDATMSSSIMASSGSGVHGQGMAPEAPQVPRRRQVPQR